MLRISNCILILVLVLCLSLSYTLANTGDCDFEKSADSSQWSGWRSGPIDFPTYMNPVVPETLTGGEPIDLGSTGKGLVAILPDKVGDDAYAKALLRVGRWYLGKSKGKGAELLKASDFNDAYHSRNIILLGTLKENKLAQEILSKVPSNYMEGILPDGYHIKVLDNPWDKSKKVILALGNNSKAAYSAALVVYYSIHGSTHLGEVGKYHRWPVDLPQGFYWAPFEAKYVGCKETPELTKKTGKITPPKIIFGIRTWNSPTPTLNTYKRIIDVFKDYGINTINIESGGWQLMDNAAEICYEAIDYAYKRGIFTQLYVGNDSKAHYPADITNRHREMAEATKDHPGLLSWRLYNQLTSELSDEHNKMLKDQAAWLKSISDKPIGMEIVWGHSTGPMPENKIQLTKDLKSWGVISLRRFDDEPFAVLQAHVPFTVPTLATRVELRNQFWWALAGGAKGFFYEVAFNFNHFSNRGLLTWTVKPVPDGRLHEIKRLGTIVTKIDDVIAGSKPLQKDNKDAPKVILNARNKDIETRALLTADKKYCILIINNDLEKKSVVSFNLPELSKSSRLVDVIAGQTLRKRKDSYMIKIEPGDAACLCVE
jgi:hypothetical protein